MSCVRADRTWKLRGPSYWCFSDAQVMLQRDLGLECGLGFCISDKTPRRCCRYADCSCNGAQVEAIFFFLKAYFYLLERQRKKESYRDRPSAGSFPKGLQQAGAGLKPGAQNSVQVSSAGGGGPRP